MPLSITDGVKFGIGFVICMVIGQLLFIIIGLSLMGAWIRSILFS